MGAFALRRRLVRRVSLLSLLSLTLGTGVAVAGTDSPLVASSASTTAAPIVAYTLTNSGAFPYDAVALPTAYSGLRAVGAIATGLDNTGTTMVATRSDTGDIALADPTYFANPILLSSFGVSLPSATGDPAVASDSAGRFVVAYVAGGVLEVVRSHVDTAVATWHDGSAEAAPANLETASVNAPGASSFVGQPVISVLNDQPQITVATAAGGLWSVTVSADAIGTPSLTPLPLSPPTALVVGSPVALSASGGAWAVAVSVSGVTHLDLVTCSASCSARDLTALTSSSAITPALAGATTSTSTYIGALSASGHALIFSSTAPTGTTWSVADASSASGAPGLIGRPVLSVSPNSVLIGGTAINWGDFFILRSSTGRTGSFHSVDASATGGSSAQTINGNTAVISGPTGPTFLAGGVNSPAPTGTGLYAIPLASYPQSISDGWPVLSDTGGLGTTSSPWVQTPSSSNITNSFDYLVGRDIANSHQRRTWISFWTVSGPLAGEPATAATFYTHGFAAGAAVATTIDRYRTSGLGLQPDWVALDPEGYPDYHSCLDGQINSSACPPTSSANWAQIVLGWEAGLASVDAKLHPAIYASQYEYRIGNLAALPIPVFVAIGYLWKSVKLTQAAVIGATSIQVSSNLGVNPGETIYVSAGTHSATAIITANYDGNALSVPLTAPLTFSYPAGTTVNALNPPVKLASTNGPNIFGYIAFGLGSWCGPIATQEAFLSQAPWNGLYNTLQLDGGVYCPR